MPSLDPPRPHLYGGYAANWSEERCTKLQGLAEGRIPGGQAEAAVTPAGALHDRSVAEANGRAVARHGAHPADTIDYARLLRSQGKSYGGISVKTGIPKASLHRHMEGSSRDA